MYHRNSNLAYLQNIKNNLLLSASQKWKSKVKSRTQTSIFQDPLGNFKGWFFCLFFLLPILLSAQGRDHLEAKRKKLIQEIGQTNSRLTKTQKNKKNTFLQYLSLQSTVKTREELILVYEEELLATDTAIIRTHDVIESLEDDQKRLKEDYAAMLRHAYRMKLHNNELQFLFAAKSFNEAYQRFRYLRQYDNYRKKQVR